MKAQQAPNAALYRADPQYVTELVARCMAANGLTNQGEVAARIGVSVSALKSWKAGRSAYQYTDQYTLERLAGV